MSKYKQDRRQKRLQEQRRNTLLGVLAVVVIAAIVIAIPSMISAAQPVGEFKMITPEERPMADGRAMGDPNAPVKIEVFEDFQCPACASYTENTEKRIAAEMIPSGQVYYVFRQFPFLDDRSASKESDQAANASMCALEQDRFWDYHDMLYANQSGENMTAFSDKRLLAFAEALSLDMNSFEKCFEGNLYQEEINQDFQDGVSLGVQGTPTVFVNGKVINPGYVPSFEEIKAAVDAALGGS